MQSAARTWTLAVCQRTMQFASICWQATWRHYSALPSEPAGMQVRGRVLLAHLNDAPNHVEAPCILLVGGCGLALADVSQYIYLHVGTCALGAHRHL